MWLSAACEERRKENRYKELKNKSEFNREEEILERSEDRENV